MGCREPPLRGLRPRVAEAGEGSRGWPSPVAGESRRGRRCRGAGVVVRGRPGREVAGVGTGRYRGAGPWHRGRVAGRSRRRREGSRRRGPVAAPGRGGPEGARKRGRRAQVGPAGGRSRRCREGARRRVPAAVRGRGDRAVARRRGPVAGPGRGGPVVARTRAVRVVTRTRARAVLVVARGPDRRPWGAARDRTRMVREVVRGLLRRPGPHRAGVGECPRRSRRVAEGPPDRSRCRAPGCRGRVAARIRGEEALRRRGWGVGRGLHRGVAAAGRTTESRRRCQAGRRRWVADARGVAGWPPMAADLRPAPDRGWSTGPRTARRARPGSSR